MMIEPLHIFRAPLPISLGNLRTELANIQTLFPFENGPFGCSIPLISPKLISPDFVDHYNNNPSANIITQRKSTSNHPCFQYIFDLFDAPITAFRLIKRPPYSSYELHEDSDRGENVCRFQVPIFSGANASLCLSDTKEIPEVRSQPDLYTPELFKKRFASSRIEVLEEGWLYSFNVDCVHTLYNGDSNPRITLIIDVVKNKKVSTWMNENMIKI